MNRANPLLGPVVTPPAPVEQVEPSPVLGAGLVADFGPAHPLGETVPAPTEDTVPAAKVHIDPLLWVVGMHGGAGASTVTALLTASAASGDERQVLELREQLPAVPSGFSAPRVLLVCRTHITGLTATARLAQHWATSRAGIHLLGVAVLDDAPKLPPVLITEVRRLAGMVPALWHLPWVEAWRTEIDLHLDALPRRTRRSVHAIYTAAAAQPSPLTQEVGAPAVPTGRRG